MRQRDGRMALRQWPMALNYEPRPLPFDLLPGKLRTPPLSIILPSDLLVSISISVSIHLSLSILLFLANSILQLQKDFLVDPSDESKIQLPFTDE